MRNKIQIAFDLGSHSIKSAVGRILPDGKILFCSYHPSPRNVNTGLLNKSKMIKVLNSIKNYL